MQSTFSNFFENYRIKNNYAPNETVLNVGLLQLKREVRELDARLRILSHQPLEEWNPEKIYELDEYVQCGDIYYRSKHDNNINSDPRHSTNDWEIADFWKEEDNDTKRNDFHYISFIAKQDQKEFEVKDKNLEGVPCVFVDGIFIERTEFEYEERIVRFPIGLQANQVVVLVFGITYEMGIVAPTWEETAVHGQTKFATMFDLTSPHVHVNGVLLSRDGFTYGKNWIDLYNPCNAGDVVVITNGSTVGLDAYYTKGETEKLFANYYTKAETYNTDQIDKFLDDLEQQIYTDDNIVKITSVYTKPEIDLKLDKKVDKDVYKRDLDKKADKATTVGGYGITDAYVKHEVDSMLLQKVSTEDFTAETILNIIGEDSIEGLRLDASSLGGIPAAEYYHMKKFQEITDGFLCTPKSDRNITYSFRFDYDDTLKLPRMRINNREGLYDEQQGRVFNEFNTKNLVINAQGGFKGTFWFDIHQIGVLHPEDYNWYVHVTPNVIPRNLSHDFVPKDLGYGWRYIGFMENSEVRASHFWGQVQGNVVKCYAYAELSGNSMRPWQATYHLVGYHKSISTMVHYNQGQSDIEYYRYPWQDPAEFKDDAAAVGQPHAPEQPEVMEDNGLEFLHTNVLESLSNYYHQTPIPNDWHPELITNGDSVKPGDPLECTVISGVPGKRVSVKATGKIAVKDAPTTFDQRGELRFEVKQKQPNDFGEGVLTITAQGMQEISKTISVVKD